MGQSEPDISAGHLRASADATSVYDVAEKVHMEVSVSPAKDSPIRSSSFAATAWMPTALETVYGFGAGPSAELARLRATMECIERYAQFAPQNPPVAVVDTYASLKEIAISPSECGLYSSAQYATQNFGFAPFSEHTPLEWVEVLDLLSGAKRLVPVEFVYPRVLLTRSRLVAETSNGTAAHVNQDSAVVAAACEVVERDSVMLFWYRQPRTAAMPIEAIPAPQLRDELRTVQAMGFLIKVCYLVYDVGIPCFLIVALKGNNFAYGLGCHPSWRQALGHAVTELGQSLVALRKRSRNASEYRFLPDIRTPEDHYALYNRKPFHDVLRHYLTRMSGVKEPGHWDATEDESSGDTGTLEHLIETLASLDYRIYTCDLTPAVLKNCGVHVTRVLVPGLIPIHFGYDRLRLGCGRLWKAGHPGRLSTLLPHFVA